MYNTKPKLIFDIIPASSPKSLDLKANVESQFRNEKSVLGDKAPKGNGGAVGQEKKPVSWRNRPDFDELLSNIIKEKIPSHEELAAMMDQANDPIVELASMGAKFNGDFRPVLANVISKKEKPKSEEDEFHRKILDKIREPLTSRVARSISTISTRVPLVRGAPLLAKIETRSVGLLAGGFIKEEKVISGPEAKVADFYTKSAVLKPSLSFKSKALNFHSRERKNAYRKWFFILIALGLLAYGLTLKRELVRESFSALDNLQQARESLENFNFAGASKNFNDSYEDFNKASQNLNLMGAGLVNIFGDLPVVGKLRSARHIIEAGKLLSMAGQKMSETVSSLSQTGAILNPVPTSRADKNKVKPSRIVAQIKDALHLSGKNLQKAKILLANIDDSVIPEDKRSDFYDFKDKIPLFEQYLGDAIEYADFLEGIIGIDQPKKYLLLFENNSELRPTGGFPGTYGVVSFASGGLSDFFVNDIYNLDGQLQRNIIPPKQLQHITPNWGMRDSAWFLDFPISAKKAMWFFEQEAGYGVDGVIALNPDVVSEILGIVGPIELPAYDITLTADNFRDVIQAEVEYGSNRTQPKQVVSDFAPHFLEKLYSADSEKWMKIFNVLMAGLDEKDILFYFTEKSLEEFSVKKGYGGEVKNLPAGELSDYMMVTFSNIKGSKTDAVTDSDIDIQSRIEGGRVIHKVILSRQHRGGDEEHGFYNRQNPAYVRVLLPRDAELISMFGNDNPNFRPIMSYNSQFGFEHDAELSRYESEFYFDKAMGIDKYEESGKKGLGFWMITDPGTTKKVEFEYSVPFDFVQGKSYNFYFQKQPGLDWKSFKFSVQDPRDLNITGSFPLLNRIGDLYMLDTKIKKDLNINIKFGGN